MKHVLFSATDSGTATLKREKIMIKDLWTKLKDTDKPIILYGMGNGADKILNVLKSKNISPKGIFASDGFVRDKSFRGFHIENLKYFEDKYKDFTVLLCFGSARDEVIANIKKIKSKYELYAPDVPVYGENLFDLEFAQRNRTRLERVYGLLADERSQKTFKNTVLYKITGDIDYLFDCETDADEPYNNFLRLTDNENYLDLGAYRGDTVCDFLSRVKGYTSITAVEPDRKNFKKLENYAKGLEKTVLINACVLDRCATVNFDMSSSRGSSAGRGGSEINSVSVDSICKNATFIKADIEGAELKMLEGAKVTIRESLPKMAISCYHRSEDLFTIPEKVLNINRGYKIFMRHFKSLPAWDTCFYFV